MTEREQLIAWLERCDIPYWESEDEIIVVSNHDDPGDPETWKERPGDETKASGYRGFFTTFIFDDADNLLEMGAWE